MKKIILTLLFILFFVSSSFATITPGLYQGAFIPPIIKNSQQCAEPYSAGYVRIEDQGEGNVLFKSISIWGGLEIVIYSCSCTIAGSTMHCDIPSQVIDFSFYGYDAIVTNEAPAGVNIITSPASFIGRRSVRLNSCDGSDCPIVEDWMLGPDGSFPCNIGPQGINYQLISE